MNRKRSNSRMDGTVTHCLFPTSRAKDYCQILLYGAFHLERKGSRGESTTNQKDKINERRAP